MSAASQHPEAATAQRVDPCDLMRPLDELGVVDPRMRFFGIRDETGLHRTITQQDRWESAAELALEDWVPDKVLVHYDTARNLYLHAWYVYRFHVVAEQHVLATLELALRLRLDELDHIDTAKGHLPGLKSMLQTARRHGLICNTRFTSRHRWAQHMADSRVDIEQTRYMVENQLDSMVVSREPAMPTQEELEHDWITAFIEGLPQMRNQYAHGSESVRPTVLRTFEIVMELVNQLYAPRRSESAAPAL